MIYSLHRIAPQPAAILHLFDLSTSAEMRVLRCIGEFKTNSQIAQERFLTEGAAKNYVTNILRKLEVNNRIEARRLAHQSGLAKDF